jgi:hypothetical protein
MAITPRMLQSRKDANIFQQLREGWTYAARFAPIRNVLLLLALGIAPELVSVPVSTHGFWSVSSQGRVEAGLAAKDVNEHLRYLLRVLLPAREAILKFAHGGETYFDVLWESSYLYAGTGPEIAGDCIAGIYQLNAGLGFDIYQIEANDQ